MSNVTLVAAPAGVWKSGRTFVSTSFNAATQSVGVLGSGISALAEHATTYETTTRVDCALVVLNHRERAIHTEVRAMVEFRKDIHTYRGIKGPFDTNKCYDECLAILEAKIPT